MHSGDWSRIVLGLAVAVPIPYVAYAEIYLNESQAANVLFPGVSLKAGWVDLSPSEMKAVEKASGKKVTSSRVRIWRGPQGEALIIDHVLGKHEYITYAVAISPAREVKGVEILEYRENYGYQIRDEKWREQFTGKTIVSPIKLDKDIKNISGATLSCQHVTEGIRRVLHTYDLIKSKS
jgi:Na+-translocating ferredoxin:NAD+ oxidoreductase RnfG subunit